MTIILTQVGHGLAPFKRTATGVHRAGCIQVSSTNIQQELVSFNHVGNSEGGAQTWKPKTNNYHERDSRPAKPIVTEEDYKVLSRNEFCHEMPQVYFMLTNITADAQSGSDMEDPKYVVVILVLVILALFICAVIGYWIYMYLKADETNVHGSSMAFDTQPGNLNSICLEELKIGAFAGSEDNLLLAESCQETDEC